MKMMENGKNEKDYLLGPFVVAIGGSRNLSCGLIRRLNVVIKFRLALPVKQSVVTPLPHALLGTLLVHILENINRYHT